MNKQKSVRKDEKVGDTTIYTLPRANILRTLKKYSEGISKQGLADVTKINRASVLHHLIILERVGLVEISKRQKERGGPKIVTMTREITPRKKEILNKFEIFEAFFT